MGDENVAQDLEEGGQSEEIKMLYKSGRRGCGDENVLQDWEEMVGKRKCCSRVEGVVKELMERVKR
jgi:hypothetical protein